MNGIESKCQEELNDLVDGCRALKRKGSTPLIQGISPQILSKHKNEGPGK